MLTLLLIFGVLALLGLMGWSLLKAGAKPAPRPVPLATAKGRPMAYCADCGRLIAVRKGDGMPYAGRHACRIVRAVVTVEQDENGVTVTRVDPRFSDGDAA